ncbi:MAG: D-alanyl-D-alanine carboxypeptidase family protein [Christensenellales bacterium]
MKKQYLSLILCFLLIAVIYFSSVILPSKVQMVSGSEIDLNAKAMVVLESESGRVLYEKNKDTQLAMASTTKIMTALVAIENTSNLDEIFAIDNRAVGIEGTSIYLRKDEHLSMRHLLLGLMLASGNDASLAIAYKVGNGSLQNFVDLMNKKVEDLGLHNTHFDNPHGLDSKTHYTSAYDLAKITAKAMENESFREIVKTKFAQIPSNIQGQNRFLRNKHKLLQEDMLGCEGVKTGFTDNALRCCVTSVMRNNMRLICVVLNCPNMFEDSKAILEKSFENYSKINLLEANKYIESLPVKNCNVESVKTYTKSSCNYPLKQNEISKINTKVILPEFIESPLEKDSEIGEFKIYLDNDLIFSTKIYTMEAVEEKDYSQKLKDILENWS